MKRYIFILIFGLAFFSCEKEPETKPGINIDTIPGAIGVTFVENARLNSAFNLVNSFHLEISQVEGTFYFSKLPTDSIDYVINMLKTKSYLNSDYWYVHSDEGVFYTYGTGRIAVACTMAEMDESNQADWAITAAILRLEEKPALKSFLLNVPVGEEIYWRDKFRQEYIVSQAELVYIFGYN